MGAQRVIKLLVISDIVRPLRSLFPPQRATHRKCLTQICPWCYIGQREMERAVEMCRDLPIDVEIEYRPYRIYPSLKDGQFMEKRPWYEERFGKDKTQEMERVALQRADELGLNM